jgi:hypothetical protein
MNRQYVKKLYRNKFKVVPVHTMKARRVSSGTVTHLNLGTSNNDWSTSRPGRFLPGKVSQSPRTALFWVITQTVVVISYRPFGKPIGQNLKVQGILGLRGWD